MTLVISEGAPTNFGKDHEDCINPNCPNKNYTAETAKDTYLNLVMEDKDSTEANKAEKLKQISPAMLIQDSKKTLNQLPFFFISHYTNDTFVCYRFAEEFIEGIKKKDPKSTRYKSYIKACTEITSGSDVHNSYNTIDFNVYKDTLEAFKEGKYDL